MAQVARERVGIDPLTGGVLIVFTNRRLSRLKVLWVERHGFCLLYKRLHQAVFELPAAATGSSSIHIDVATLAKLLAGVPKSERTKKGT